VHLSLTFGLPNNSENINMMKNLIFPLALILVFAACSKSEDNSITSSVKPLPTSITTIDTTGGIANADTSIFHFAYDSLSRVTKVSDKDGFYTYDYASNGNLLKRSRFSTDSVMQEYRVFYYSLNKVVKIEDYNNIGVKSILGSKRKFHIKSSSTTGNFVLQNWYAFNYLTGTSQIDSIYAAISVNTPNYYQKMTYDGKGNIASCSIQGNNKGSVVNLSSTTYTYDTKNNVFRNYPNNTDLLIDSIGSIGTNNAIKEAKTSFASDGSSSSLETQYEITYNNYGYPTEIKGGKKIVTITYNTDKTATTTTSTTTTNKKK
jgi:hypothetical protein